MTPHLRRSRVTKALTDAGIVESFAAAEARLDAVRPCVVVGTADACAPAGQAAALTAVATACKCFGRVSLAAPDAPLRLAFPLGATLRQAAAALGAQLVGAPPADATHLVGVGADDLDPAAWQVHCWWDRWRAGVRGYAEPCGDPRLGPAGVFAGALAVRQLFAWVLRGAGFRPRDASVSLWEPWNPAAGAGPARFTAPVDLWLVGLGHLGQAYVWTLLTLPYTAGRRAVVQDDERIGPENEPTSLLVTGPTEEKKARLASRWLEAGGWSTDLIERRHRGEQRPTPEDPPFLLAGLDNVDPRRTLAGAGFDFMVDGGIGRGPGDFEGLQVRVLAKGADVAAAWNAPEGPQHRDALLERAAYKALEAEGVACGAFALAGASVAVPFVGAATAAVAVGQLCRLASGAPGGALVQLGLAAPELILDGGRTAAPAGFLGGEFMDLDAGVA